MLVIGAELRKYRRLETSIRGKVVAASKYRTLLVLLLICVLVRFIECKFRSSKAKRLMAYRQTTLPDIVLVESELETWLVIVQFVTETFPPFIYVIEPELFLNTQFWKVQLV